MPSQPVHGYSGIAIALCINFIGDGLRDAFDPRQRRRLTRKDKENARMMKNRSEVAS